MLKKELKKKIKKKLLAVLLPVFGLLIVAAVVMGGLLSAVSFFDGLFDRGVSDVENCSIDELISYCDDDDIITEDMLDDMMITRKSLKRLLVAVNKSNEDDENTSFSVSVQSKVTYLDEKGKKKTMKGSTKQVTATTEQVTKAYELDWQPVYVAVVTDALRNGGDTVKKKKELSENPAVKKFFLTGTVAEAAKKGFSGADLELVGNTNEDKIWNYFKAKGLNDIAVAAMCGNIQAESTYRTEAISESGTYHGICQWGGGRYSNLCQWAARRKVPWTDLKTQLDYAWAELNSKGYRKTLDYLKTAKQLQYDSKDTGAVWFIVRWFEGGVSSTQKYGIQQYDRKFAFAKAALTKHGGKGNVAMSTITDDDSDETAADNTESSAGSSVGELKIGRWNEKGTRIILTKQECESVVEDFAPKYTWSMEQAHDYTFEEAKNAPGAVKKTSGTVNSKNGMEVWYEPGAKLVSAELCFADIRESEILKNLTRFKNIMLRYMDDYDQDWVETVITSLPGGQACYEHFRRIIDAATGESTDTSGVITATSSLSASVERYRSAVKKEAEKYGKGEFTDLFLAVMQQESNGSVPDVFQASESLGLKPGTLDTKRSIKQGVKYLCACLDAAGCKSPTDIDKIKLALQGYNFGNGYIGYALKKDGKWTQANTIAFAKEKSKGRKNVGSRIEALGPWRYGDSYYTKHVLRYYSYGNMGNFDAASIKVSTDEKEAIAVPVSKRFAWLFPNGLPVSSEQAIQYMTQITVPIINESGQKTSMRLTVNKKLAANYKGAFQDMCKSGFKIKSGHTACYCFRLMNSGPNKGKKPSYHSYGACCDVNDIDNMYVNDGRPNQTGPYSVTQKEVNIWKKHGFLWGGDWHRSGYRDYMHFTYTGN